MKNKKYSKAEPESIQAMFGSIAQQYDRTNAVLSFQLHRYWNRLLVSHVSGNSLADLCCGTGEIALAFLKRSQESKKAYLMDFCPEMLSCAQEKAAHLDIVRHQVDYITADVQKIPLDNLSVDCATIAYGIRNVKEPRLCIEEVYRILQTGGQFGILELTRPNNKILRKMHQLYLRYVLPIVGKCLTSNQNAYEYLCQSIHHFTDPDELVAILKKIGFVNIVKKPLTGGIATLIVANKP